MKCRHKWEFVAESTQSTNDWCEKCGAWRRYDLESGKTLISKPKLYKTEGWFTDSW